MLTQPPHHTVGFGLMMTDGSTTQASSIRTNVVRQSGVRGFGQPPPMKQRRLSFSAALKSTSVSEGQATMPDSKTAGEWGIDESLRKWRGMARLYLAENGIDASSMTATELDKVEMPGSFISENYSKVP